MNGYLKTLWCLVLVSALAFAGCRLLQKKARQEDVDKLASKPDINTLSVTNSYTPQAIGASGGYRAWADTEKMELDCIVTLYENDGGSYLTEHHHEVHPWANSIRISAREPQGKIVWQLTAGQYSMLAGTDTSDSLPVSVSKRDFAEAILDITTSAVRLLDKSYQFVEGAKPVKTEGLWYLPIERRVAAATSASAQRDIEPVGPSKKSYWSRVVFYQRRDGSLVDMIWFADVQRKKFVMVRGYDYCEVEKGGVLVPTKVEIYRTDTNGALRQRLAKIHYHTLKSSER